MRKIGILIFVLLNSHLNTQAQYVLSLVEEFQIESFLPIDIVDFDASKGRYLGYMNHPDGERVLILGKAGEILSSETLVGSGPNQFSSTINALAFSPIGNVWIQSPSHILEYDDRLRLVQKEVFESINTLGVYGRAALFQYFPSSTYFEEISFFTTPTGSTTNFFNDPARNWLVETFSIKTKSKNTIGNVKERRMYSKLQGDLFGTLFYVIYGINPARNLLYLTSRYDAELSVYDLSSGTVKKVIPIRHGDFKFLAMSKISGKDIPAAGRISLASTNHQLIFLDSERVVLDYIVEIPYGIYEQKAMDDPRYHHFNDPDYHRLIIFENYEQVSQDIPVPKNGKLMMGLPGNRMLFQLNDPSIEEDFIRYQVYEVIKKN